MKKYLELNFLIIVYEVVGVGTFIHIAFFDERVYTWWNWPLIFGTSVFFGGMWPIYWLYHWAFEFIKTLFKSLNEDENL